MQKLLKNLPGKIILASASPRRRQLLEEIGFTFQVEPVDIDETNQLGASPEEFASQLAEKKATIAAQKFPDALVIGADTVVVQDNHIMGKPADAKEARIMLDKLSGQFHQVITGVSLIKAEFRSVFYESTTVHFKRMMPAEIEWYIQTGEPMDKAGAYGIQGKGGLLVERIDGSYSNVVGLPMAELVEELLNLEVIEPLAA